MNCADFIEGLLDYHFAVETQERREANRAHLLTCGDCAQQYFDLKHDIDSGAAQRERPSEAARDRLHGAVAQMFTPSLFARTRGWLQQPTPRYRVGAVMVAAAMAVLLLWPGRPPIAPPDEETKEARLHSPEHLAEHLAEPHFSSRGVPQIRAVPASIVDSARIDALSISYY